MARKRDRFFALMGALLFLLSASALTIAVVYDSITNKDDTTNTANTQTADTNTCNIQQPVSAAAEKLPDNYDSKNTDVTELKTEDLAVGTGATVKNGDCLYVKYYGTLGKDGSKFDENYTQSTAIQFTLGAGDVIPGWDQGLVGMKVGGVRRLVIPSDLGYKDKLTRVFLVKVVKIK